MMGSRDGGRRESARAVVTDEAAEWLLRLQAGESSHGVRAELVDWLRESPVHVAEFLRVCQVHGALQEFQGWTALPALDANVADAKNVVAVGARGPSETIQKKERVERSQTWKRARPWPWLSAVAAMVCAVAIGVVWLSGGLGFGPAYGFGLGWRSIETGTAERREVVLADGSVVDVSPVSRLSVRFESGVRRVVLVRGDALFRVARDVGRPFVVEAGSARVRAVGTAFGVQRRLDSSVVVTVAEGRVAVTRHEGGVVARTFGGALPFVAAPVVLEEIALTAGQQIALPDVGKIGEVKEVDSGRELAWAEGRLIFEHDQLAAVVQQFNRHNVVQIRLSDDRLGARTISGVFSATDPESFVAFLETVARVKVMRNDAREILITNAEEVQQQVQ